MKLNTPISALLNTPMTTADLQMLLLNGKESVVSATSTPFTSYLSHVDRMLGGLHKHQSEFMINLFNAWNEPASEMIVSSARQLGTTVALLTTIFHSMMINPHQTIVFVAHNSQMSKYNATSFRDIVAYMEENCGYPKVLTRSKSTEFVSQVNGRVIFMTASSNTNTSLRGHSICKMIVEHSVFMSNTQLHDVAQMISYAKHQHANIVVSNTGYKTSMLSPDATLINRKWDDHPDRGLAYFDDMKSIISNPTVFNQEMNI